MKIVILSAVLMSVVTVSADVSQPCPDSRDPGCCLQFVKITKADGTVESKPLGYDPVKNQCTWPEGYNLSPKAADKKAAAAVKSLVYSFSSTQLVPTIFPSTTSTLTTSTATSSSDISVTSTAATPTTTTSSGSSITTLTTSDVITSTSSSNVPTIAPTTTTTSSTPSTSTTTTTTSTSTEVTSTATSTDFTSTTTDFTSTTTDFTSTTTDFTSTTTDFTSTATAEATITTTASMSFTSSPTEFTTTATATTRSSIIIEGPLTFFGTLSNEIGIWGAASTPSVIVTTMTPSSMPTLPTDTTTTATTPTTTITVTVTGTISKLAAASNTPGVNAAQFQGQSGAAANTGVSLGLASMLIAFLLL